MRPVEVELIGGPMDGERLRSTTLSPRIKTACRQTLDVEALDRGRRLRVPDVATYLRPPLGKTALDMIEAGAYLVVRYYHESTERA